jgi:hypothetical protein
MSFWRYLEANKSMVPMFVGSYIHLMRKIIVVTGEVRENMVLNVSHIIEKEELCYLNKKSHSTEI